MQFLTTTQAGIELAHILKRKKPYGRSYMLKLIKARKITPANTQRPWLIELTQLQDYAKRYANALRNDNRVKRHFDQ